MSEKENKVESLGLHQLPRQAAPGHSRHQAAFKGSMLQQHHANNQHGLSKRESFLSGAALGGKNTVATAPSFVSTSSTAGLASNYARNRNVNKSNVAQY